MGRSQQRHKWPLRVMNAAEQRRAVLKEVPADIARGIGLVLAGYFSVTLGDVAAKAALPAAGVAMVMMGRGAIGAATIAGLAILRAGGLMRGLRRLKPRRGGLVLLRSLLQAFSSMAWYAAWRTMSLADTFALGFTSPLIVTLLAVPILGERLRWWRMAATVTGFLGVLVMLRPGTHFWHPVVPLLMAGIFAMALTRVMMRLLSASETPEGIAFAIMIVQIAAGAGLLSVFPPAEIPPLWTWLAILGLGVANATANLFYAHAFALAPASALAPYEYSLLLWGALFGWLAFGNVLSLNTLAGASVVMAAGLYTLHRERLLRRRAGSTTQPAGP